MEENLKKILKTTDAYIKILQKNGIKNLRDFLLYFPRDYEDRTNLFNVQEVRITYSEKKVFSIKGQVIEKKYYRKKKSFYVAKCKDVNGDNFFVTFFDKGYGISKLDIGKWYIFSGKLKLSGKIVSFFHPDIALSSNLDGEEVKNFGIIYPIYSELNGIKASWFFKKMSLAIKYVDKIFGEYLPDDFLKEFELLDIVSTIKNIHFPQDKNFLLSARKRIFFDRLLRVQLHSLLEKKDYQKSFDVDINPQWTVVSDFVKKLPFELTYAQKKVIKEIIEDFHSGKSMLRLLQGDVGSGKTIVAALSCFYMKKVFNKQSVFIAPLEVLASQHYENLSKLFLPLGINICVLKGSLSQKQKQDVKEKIKIGFYDIIVGTHAIIQDDVEFYDLGFVVIDEQHKFGVRQRAFFKSKGSPHILQMSATPIPRSLALAFFGEFSVSIIDELPKGRKPIITKVISPQYYLKLKDWLLKKIFQGEQVYIVTPLIEESQKLDDVASALQEFEKIKDFLSPITDEIGLLHGKMFPKEKNLVMSQFKNGDIKVLVSTTVIEVGVDVPQATVMIIKNAERFGLSQLHQLRGRIGRGEKESYCFLETKKKSGDSYKRLKVMEEVGDGFKLAEIDMKYRGAGEILGTRQSGVSDIPPEILGDMKFIKKVGEGAKWLLNKYPNLEGLPGMKKYLNEKLQNIIV